MIEIPDDIRIVSVMQPWNWAIFNGKDIENRSRPTNRRGWILIHAGKRDAFPLNPENREWFRSRYGLVIPNQLPHHGITGMVRIVDSVTESTSKWWEGPCGYVLADAIQFPTRKGPGGVVLPFLERDGFVSPLPALTHEVVQIRRYLQKLAD